MKKRLIFVIAVWFMVLPAILFPQEEQKKIVEEVSVNWWQVPVFAVDKDGNPVNDLAPGDIEIVMNGRIIPGFSLDKRSFSVTARKEEVVPAAPAVPAELVEPSRAETPPLRNKLVLLLFDLTQSGERSIVRAKSIAKKIVEDAEKSTRFIVLTIEAFPGLVYIGDGSSENREFLVNLITEKVKKRQNTRIPRLLITSESGSVGGRGKYEPTDTAFFREAASKYFTRRNMGFFYAFETLYFYLNSLQENKFVYFFSEGISRAIQFRGRSLAGAKGQDDYYLKRVARCLSRSGAVLFIVNSLGVLDSYSSSTSGEDSLLLLARETGGTYLEGTRDHIAARLENLHHAYYEVSFPDIPQISGKTREITITAKREGIRIYTLHILEKKKKYMNMIPIEKEMLVLNLISQPPNPLISGIIGVYNAQVEKIEKKRESIVYTVTLPPGYLYKHLDLYKVWLDVDPQGISQLEKIETEALYPKKNPLKIEFELSTVSTGKEQKKTGPGKEAEKTEPGKETIAETRAYFVLVNKDTEPVRGLVWGSENYQEDPELEELEKTETAKKIPDGKTISPEEMERILQGAADYCERLKQSAFHFYCREKITETHKPLLGLGYQIPYDEMDQVSENDVRGQGYSNTFAQVKNREFGYRLFKQGNNIKEERNYISSGDEMEVRGDQVITANAFFTERTVFGPVTVLDRGRQENYDIRFVRFDEYKGRPAVVIEALPKNPAETPGTYGKIWIDREDFSVLKIEADPKSIRGYNQLKEMAEKLNTRLYLTLESEYNEIHAGLRFPTKVRMSEKYKGGRTIIQNRGSMGWERTVAEFTYTDYQFFDVQTEVKVQK